MKKLNDKLRGFIDSSVLLSSSHLMIISEGEIIYWKSPQGNDNVVCTRLSNDIRRILNKFERNINSAKELFIKNAEDTIPLFEKDSTVYAGQVFLPIWYKNKLKMVLIYYRTIGGYIESSTKVMKTTASFVPRFIELYG